MGLDLEKIFAIKFSTMPPDLDFFPTKNFLTMPLDLENVFNSIFFFFTMPLELEKIFEMKFVRYAPGLDFFFMLSFHNGTGLGIYF